MRTFVSVSVILLDLFPLVGLTQLSVQNEESGLRESSQTVGIADLNRYEEIPRSSSDPCRYFLVESRATGNSMRVIVAQDCPTWGTTFTEREYDCENLRTRYLGDNGSSPNTIQPISPPDPWARVVPGSSAADTATLVCGPSETKDPSSNGLGVSREGIRNRLGKLELGWTYEETEPLLDGRERMFASLEYPTVVLELIGDPDNLGVSPLLRSLLTIQTAIHCQE